MTDRGNCFVIMGYGVKTDLATGRELDLDKTYKNIIKPAAEEAGLSCTRADEIKHSGTIDVPMFERLIGADVVIADLSTSNTNAFYELGVRHALRPKTTIAISESELKPPFDVNHTIIHQYEHLGKDIGHDEVKRFTQELVDTINTILDSENVDSPVYTYLNDLIPPYLENNDIEKVDNNEGEVETLSTLIEKAKDDLNNDRFIEAKALLEHASTLDQNNDYVIQKLALATYKSKQPTHLKALKEALEIINELDIYSSTDPETLGIAGAIFKRLWEQEQIVNYLNKSIFFYEKGFYIKNDYYNGINLAYLLDVRSTQQDSSNEKITDHSLANRIRNKVIDICTSLQKSSTFEERNDKYWIFATLEEAYYGLDLYDKYNHFREKALSLSGDNWERESTEEQITKLSDLKEV